MNAPKILVCLFVCLLGFKGVSTVLKSKILKLSKNNVTCVIKLHTSNTHLKFLSTILISDCACNDKKQVKVIRSLFETQ